MRRSAVAPGLVFAYFAMKPEPHRAGMVFALAVLAPIVLHRVIGLLGFGPVETMTRAMAGLKVVMLELAIALWFADSQRTA